MRVFLILFFWTQSLFSISQADTTKENFDVIFGGDNGIKADSIIPEIGNKKLIGNWQLKTIVIENGPPKKDYDLDTIAIKLVIRDNRTITIIQNQQQSEGYWFYDKKNKALVIHLTLDVERDLISTSGISFPLSAQKKNTFKLVADFGEPNNSGNSYITQYEFIRVKENEP